MPTTVWVAAWRDHDASTIGTVPRLSLGVREVVAGAAAARGLAEAGARRVRLSEPVDGRSGAAVPALSLVRELTALGVAVDWDLTADAATVWPAMSNLYPPRTLHAGPDGAAALERWRAGFFLGRFVVRRGPGFYQFRDWRWGWLRLSTVSDAAGVELVAALLDDAASPSVDAAAAVRLSEPRLLHRVGDRLWLPAYRVRRWPVPAYLV